MPKAYFSMIMILSKGHWIYPAMQEKNLSRAHGRCQNMSFFQGFDGFLLLIFAFKNILFSIDFWVPFPY